APCSFSTSPHRGPELHLDARAGMHTARENALRRASARRGECDRGPSFLPGNGGTSESPVRPRPPPPHMRAPHDVSTNLETDWEIGGPLWQMPVFPPP